MGVGKQHDVYFTQQSGGITREKTNTSLRKKNVKRKNEPLLIASQNNAILTGYINT